MQNKTYHLTVNDTHEFDVIPESDAAQLDAIAVSGNQFHIIRNGVSYRAEVLDSNLKSVRLRVNGSVYDVKITDPYDLLIKKMGLSAYVVHKISEIKAPMPGLVLTVVVSPEEEVVHGDPLIILEAMKMENVIKSPGEGRIKRVIVQQGMSVDKGDVMIEMY
jgi:biotin carboxyl carrier protein